MKRVISRSDHGHDDSTIKIVVIIIIIIIVFILPHTSKLQTIWSHGISSKMLAAEST